MSETTTDQGTLFGADGAPTPPEPASVAHARRTDPPTSHAAAASVDELPARQRAILSLLREDPADHVRLIERYVRLHAIDPDSYPRQTDQSIRSRCAELRTKGLVRDSGARVVLASGRQSIVWEATP